MTPSGMEELTTPSEPYSAPPASRPVSLPPAWRSLFESRERRWWTIALTATLLITAFGIGVLYVDDSNNQAAVRSLTTQNESLTGRNLILQDQLKATQANLTASLGELAATKAALEHPHMTIWNVPQQLKGPTYYLAGGVPDTFTYHLHATSTGPMSVSIITLQQWAAAIQCIDNGVGVTNWCMHHNGAVWSNLGVTSVSYDFHLAEGCADYVAVFTAGSSITVTPNVSVTYNPAISATGDCA